MKSILIKDVTAVDIGLNNKCDILIEKGFIKKVAENIPVNSDMHIIEAKGLIAMPSLFDMHVHLRDPGLTHKEDIITGSAAALSGGVTGLACMPNTKPTIDNEETVKYIIDKAEPTGVKVYPVGCITKGMSGTELCDYEKLKDAGIVGISDDGKPVENAEILRKALVETNKNGLLIISHCEDMDIIGKGIMHKGDISEKLGVAGMDRASEDSITAREIALAYSQNARIHIAHVSTEGSIALIRDAKKRGVKVTCETCPHYFLLTHEKLLSRDADYRMNPPLREEKDRLAMLEAIIDGTVDCIVTDHAPHTAEEKMDFETAPNGVVGLETSLSAVLTGLYHTGKINLEKIVEIMSVNPRKILGLPIETIKENVKANIVLVDTEKEWIVEPAKLHSKSHNTVFKGMTFKGKPVCTIADGIIRYEDL